MGPIRAPFLRVNGQNKKATQFFGWLLISNFSQMWSAGRAPVQALVWLLHGQRSPRLRSWILLLVLWGWAGSVLNCP